MWKWVVFVFRVIRDFLLFRKAKQDEENTSNVESEINEEVNETPPIGPSDDPDDVFGNDEWNKRVR